MGSLLQKLSPATLRIAPFAVFLLLTLAQGQFGPVSAYGFYLAKTLVGLWMILVLRPFITEMRWAFSWEAVLVGVGIFAVWVGLSVDLATQQSLWVKLGLAQPPKTPPAVWNPFAQFGEGSTVAWFFVVARILGSTLIVPPLEEMFYRSFLYRAIARQNFLEVPLNQFLPMPFIATAVVFGFAHNEWLAGILCGGAYHWLILRKNRLGDAMTAHAITNFLLGLWVVGRGAWNFW